MRDWESLADELAKQIVGDGRSTHLNNAGKRLNLNDDPYTPDDLKLANKLLKDNDLTPSWILEGRELDEARERLLARVRAGAVSEALAAEVAGFNKRVMSFNLKAPQGIEHKRMIALKREGRR